MSQEAENAEPVAVVGMSCRFAPDLDSLDKLWRFLSEGRSAVGEMPAKRWEPYAASSPRATAILRGTTRLGSFMDDIEGFDADFFGISPREAEYLDPQQRVVLELAWEALAHAGIPPLSLRGTRAGVFVSANSNDYGRRLLEDIPHTGAYAVNGTTYYGIANRISYFLDLRGPSMAVDTACAGSLTALHVACQSLRSGETPVAIVGGVNIIATPALFVALDAAGATAPDGRSKAFDAAADGYGRGEGAGVVVLKKLSDARRDGDPILAVVRGSGVYQDGRSDGMMAPNGDAQEYMLRHIYADAGIEPGTVGYVEAHGTGTPVGDREEAQALAAVFGAGRSADDPCLIGSLKPNIGHVEAGSGIAGVIKSVLSLQRGQIPPSVHTEPNPDFDWETSGLRLVGGLEDWPTGENPRRAGVSSYGVGGTTAHVILEEAPASTSSDSVIVRRIAAGPGADGHPNTVTNRPDTVTTPSDSVTIPGITAAPGAHGRPNTVTSPPDDATASSDSVTVRHIAAGPGAGGGPNTVTSPADAVTTSFDSVTARGIAGGPGAVADHGTVASPADSATAACDSVIVRGIAAGPGADGGPNTVTVGCGPAVFPLSAMSDAGLRGLAGALADYLEGNPATALAAVGHTLASRRSHLAQRGAVVARTTAELTNGLRALAGDRRLPGVVKARAVTGQADGVVWVFSGHGAQWSGMGRELLRTEPAFAVTVDALEDVFRDEMGWSAREALERGGPWTAADSQALTFAVQAGLAALWTARGVVPAAIIGHSVGEIAAAVAAGCLDLRQAARFACRRANALRQLEGSGAMAMVALPFAELEELLRGEDDAVAAISASTRSTVVSGGADAIERLAARWAADGLDVRRVDTDIAFHSARIDAVLAPITAAANELDPHAAGAQVPLYTTALADPRSEAPRDGEYWAANVRRPVRFAQAVEAAVADGFRLFLEVSAHPVVTHSITEVLDHLGAEDGIAVGTLRRDTPEAQAVAANLALLHCHGAAVDWSTQHPDGGLADLPAMAWQHKPYWIFPDGGPNAGVGTGTGAGHDPGQHSLLGGRMTVSGAPARQVWQTHLDMSCRPYPQSHEVVGVEITPAAAIINTFILTAGRGGRAPGLSDIVLRTPLAVVPPRVVQVVLAENTVRLASRVAEGPDGSGEDEHEWITHTTATIKPGRTLAEATVDPDVIRPRCDDEWDWDRVDGLFRTKGVGGYAFPWDLEELRTNGEEQLSILTLEPAPARYSSSWAHVIDGALTISAVLVTPEDARRLWMSSHMDSVVFRGEPPARITVHTVRSPQSPVDTVDVQVADEDGTVVCEVMGLRFAALQDQLGPIAAPRDLVHEITWRPFELAAAATTKQSTASEVELADPVLPHTVLLGEVVDTNRLAVQFEAAGVRCSLVSNPGELRDVTLPNPGIVLVVPSTGPADERPEDAADRNAWTLIQAAQALAEARKVAWEDAAPDVRLWCLTEGVRGASTEAALGQAPLWGVARIIAGEHPELWGGLVDVTPALDPHGATESLAAHLIPLLRHAAGQEDVISLDGSQTSVARLARIERTPDGTPVQCRPSGTYLITGGLGALGLLVARWLVDRGASRFLLASRRGLPPRAQWAAVRDARTRAQIDGVLALEALGVTVKVLALDITDAEQVAAALDPAAHGLPPLRGIVHAAGVVRDAMLDKVDRDGLSAVLGPKAAGAMVLHRLFPPGSLDFFVMFSSCGQFARLTGQTSYAAANSFLDALAEHRRAGGHTDTVSLAWTAWRGIGMSETITGTMMEANARGLDAVSPAEAFRAWAFAERYASPYQAVLRVLPLPATTPKPPMLRDLTAAEADPAAADGAGTTVALDWAGTPEAELREFVTADVREQVAAELYQAAEDVELRRPLVELGFDSVLTVALRVRLNRRYGVDLPPTILWNKPTVCALAGHLVDTLRPNSEV